MSVDPAATEVTAGAGEVGVRVLRGHPDAAETAALVAVLLARAAAPAPTVPVVETPLWAAPRARLRSPVAPGPGRWRASAGPLGQ